MNPCPSSGRRGLALRRTLEEMSIFIEPDELVVGNHSSHPKAAPIFPEYSVGWLEKEIDDIDRRQAEAYQATPQVKAELKKICLAWKGKTLQEHAHALLTPELEEIHATRIIKAEGNMTSGDGHVAIHLGKVLKEGIGGYLRRVKEALAGLDDASFSDLKKRQLYLAMLDGLDGLFRVHRALRRAVPGTRPLPKPTPARQRTAADRRHLCRHHPGCSQELSAGAPAQRHFADRSTNRVQRPLPLLRASGPVPGTVLRPGPEGRHPRPRDGQGTAVLDVAQADLHQEGPVVVPHQNVGRRPAVPERDIGGVGPDGQDATNALSFVILESVGEMKLTQPNLSIRYHSGMSAEFMAAAIQVIEKGFGMPAFNNDEVVIPGMLRLGVSLEDARDYSAIGCIEVAVPGKWGYRTTGMSFLNFMRVFLAALNDGKDSATGKTFLPGTGDLNTFVDFEGLMGAWKKQVQFYARAAVAIDVAVDTALEGPGPRRAVFHLHRRLHRPGQAPQGGRGGLRLGLGSAGRHRQPGQLPRRGQEAGLRRRRHRPPGAPRRPGQRLRRPRGEVIRQRLLNGAPKYGNDDDEVDRLVVEAYGAFADEVETLHNTRWGRGPIGGGYYPGTSSISSNVPSGSEVGATPDGRHAGTPLAEGCSPSSGTDLLGPTAVFNSVGQAPGPTNFRGSPAQPETLPKSIESPNDKKKLEAMLRTFFDDLKGWHVQYNIVSRETLIAAKKDPEKYRDLVVRVAGYSAFFRDLAPDTHGRHHRPH